MSIRLARMNHRRGEHHQPFVVMVLIVPLEECPQELPSLLETGESVRKGRMVFQGFELTFRIGVIIRHLWSAMRRGNPQVRPALSYSTG